MKTYDIDELERKIRSGDMTADERIAVLERVVVGLSDRLDALVEKVAGIQEVNSLWDGS